MYLTRMALSGFETKLKIVDSLISKKTLGTENQAIPDRNISFDGNSMNFGGHSGV